MIPQPLDVVFRFAGNAVKKLRIPRIHAAGKHEVLPDQDPVFITQPVKDVLFVNTAAPDAKHVHAAFGRRGDLMAVAFVRHFGQKAVVRDMVGPFGEYRQPV
ncbi:hypothetical protein D3C76_1663270 [compost metagenome]